MFQRSISPETIHMIIENSEIIMSYPDDTPHPGVLLLGFDFCYNLSGRSKLQPGQETL